MKMKLPMTKQQKESCDRYRKIYPVVAEGKDDIELLLYRNCITPLQASEMRTEAVREKRTAPLRKLVRPYTANQVQKIAQGAMKDFLADITHGLPEAEKEEAWEKYQDDAGFSFDMARNLLLDERMRAFFRKTGAAESMWHEMLADYFAL